MALATIFRPLRRTASRGGNASRRAREGDGNEPGASRASRVGTQRVTNLSPPGGPPTAVADARPPADEATWQACLASVFAQTGWPDA